MERPLHDQVVAGGVADPAIEQTNHVHLGAGWEAWVGRTATSTAVFDPDQANRMAVTLDRPPNFAAGDCLPPAWHWLYFHDLVEASRLGPDGHPALGVTMPPVPLKRRMWAAGSVRFHEVPRLGETATRTSTITAIAPKEGRTGPLFFVTVEHDIRVGDRLSIAEQQTVVYRDLAAESSRGSSGEAPSASLQADFDRRWVLDTTTLFRYSALTFNGHRIHYDADYARDVEGYPGLVIHGPLLATLLMDLAVENRGELDTFSYRARSPLFVPEAFTVNGRAAETGSMLWAASADGRVAMDGTATYKETSR